MNASYLGCDLDWLDFCQRILHDRLASHSHCIVHCAMNAMQQLAHCDYADRALLRRWHAAECSTSSLGVDQNRSVYQECHLLGGPLAHGRSDAFARIFDVPGEIPIERRQPLRQALPAGIRYATWPRRRAQLGDWRAVAHDLDLLACADTVDDGGEVASYLGCAQADHTPSLSDKSDS